MRQYKKPLFTEKHYYALAELLKQCKKKYYLANKGIPNIFDFQICLTEYLENDNEKFKPSKFQKYARLS